MKVFTKLGLVLLVGLISVSVLWAQTSVSDIGPKKPFAPIASDALFDLQFEWPVGVGGGEAGIETDGNYIYTSKWNGTGQFYRYGMDGTYLEEITVAGSTGCRDIAYNGTYFYGGAAATTVFEMDLANAAMISTFTAPTACRAIAYNEDDDAFYANNWGTAITKFDMTGANLGSFPVGPTGDSYYGFAYQGSSYCGEGPYLWGYAQVGTNLSTLVQIDLPSGTETGTTFDVGTVLSAVDLAGGLCIDNSLVPGYWTIMGTAQNVNIWGLELCSSGPLPTNDVGISAIVAPVSGVGLTNAEAVTVTIKNHGTAAQSNFDVSFTLDGGTPVVETISATINGGDTYDHTFATTVDLSAIGMYDFEACTDLTGDENASNDCKTKTVENMVAAYCDATTQIEDEWIANVLCGDIDNASAWQGGVADYTDQSTTIDAGASEAITVTNGNAWASDIVICWVDWNMDYTFDQGGDEEFQLLNVGGTGATFTGDISVPAGTPNGDYRMRVRMTYSTPPVPCGDANYGEVEDYTITVGEGVFLEPPTDFMAEVQNNVDVYCTWTAPGGGGSGEWIQWDAGINTGNGIGLTAGGTFYTASHWTPADLAPYDGQEITKLSFFPNGDPAATYTLMAWTGANAGTQIMSQAVASFTVDEFNEVSLTTPITIDASDELWFGYGCTHGASTFPAGCDDGPAVQYSGDMISLDGTSWVSMGFEYGLDFNWNLAAYVMSTDATYPAKPMVKSTNPNATGSFVANGAGTIVNKFNPSSSKALLGYNVYNTDGMVGYTTDTWYTDMSVDPGTYDYWATAVYDEGESGASNTDEVTIMEEMNCENFDALTVGGFVADQLGGSWTTWSGAPGGPEDAVVSDMYSSTPSNSFTVNAGTVDLILELDDTPISTGQWVYSHMMYVPTGFSGYFNIQSDPAPGVAWVIELYFDDDGTGYFAGQSTDTYTYTMDTWFMVEIEFDMDAGMAKVYFDGTMMTEFVNANTIGGVDYYGANTGGAPGAYYDDVCFDEQGGTTPTVIFEDDFEAYSVGDQLACVNPDDWTTWSNAPCGAEDPYIVDNGSNVVEITGTNDCVYVMPNWTDGGYVITFDIYIPTGADAYFNTLQDFAGAGSQWGMQVYFGETNPGQGNIDAGAALAAPFNFNYDTWYPVKTIVDLDNDYAEFWFDNQMIISWQWSTGTFGTGTLNQLGGNNFYAWDGGVNGNPLFHFDNYKIEEYGPPQWAGPDNVEATLTPPNDVLVTWDPPAGAGQLVELIQHDGNNENGYFQAYNNGYGVVYDISAYPGATIEMLDFRHSSWGTMGTWDYKLHVVDWDTYTEVAVIDNLQTTGNDVWEEGVSLGSIAGESGLVGIFLEPLSNDPADAYPCLDSDNVGPDGMSYNGVLGNYSAFTLSTIGDFLMDLWIMTGEDKVVVKAPKVNVTTNSTAASRIPGNALTVTEYTMKQMENTNSAKSMLEGFNVFRDGTNIAYVNNPAATSYLDEGLATGTYLYCVSAVYDDGESQPVCADDVVVPGGSFPAPTNLTGPAEVIVNQDIVLNWDAPGNAWMQWDAGTNTGNGIGLTNGGTFSCASHWYPADLGMYNGLSLTKVQFFANGDAAATYVIKVWTGSAGNNEVLSQAVASFTVDDWNEVILDNPVTINGTDDFWFGYEVTHGAGTFPAGCDDGPAVAYNGDMISTAGAWVSMSTDYGLDYNWNIAGWVEAADGSAAPIGNFASFASNDGSFAAAGSTGIANKMDPNSTKALTGYNVKREGSVIGFVAAPTTTYTDNVATSGLYEYCVTAVYDDGESECSDPITVDVLTSIEESILSATQIFPNPASNVVNIESDYTIESITIYNYSGQVISNEEVNNTVYKVNTSDYRSGIYFFQIDTNEGRISQRVIIK
ncbi:MAG: T9SS type A sorting domain-containing protein [Bacteroidales bacterium]|nr:T9SS type A sorting domain-containing protein [Bacteroidales bacterium]MCF8403060.1 T9SS type A sorting domain-containing protein [Bacteroidales bacterium]